MGLVSRPLPAPTKAAIAAFAVYLALLNNFLRFHGYPILRLEILYMALAGVVLAILFGLAYHFAGALPKLPCRLARSVLTAGLIVYAVSIVSTTWYALVSGAVAVALIFLLDLQLLAPIAVMAFITMTVASLGIGQQKDTFYDQTGAGKPGASQKLAIVHIILDEHIGIEGLSRRSRDAQLRELVKSFYTKHGFRVFGGAYSDFYNTANSIPFTMNLGERHDAKGGFYAAAKGNEYFQLLKTAGYRINVFQSEYIDYCSALVDLCTIYNSTYYGNIADTSLGATDKAILIGRKMVPGMVISAGTRAYMRLHDAGYRLPVPVPNTNLNPTAINAWAAFRRLEKELSDVQPGHLYFAHILLPHMPYALRPDCTLAPIAQWRERVRTQPLAEREDAYAKQLICTTRQIGAVLKAVDNTPAGRNAIVIIHGDHGSRISDFEPLAENIARIDDDDLVAGYSTLFAVRAPGIQPGYDPRHYRLVDLLHELATSGFRNTGSHPSADPVVVLVDKKMIPRRRVPLPKAW